MTCLFFLAGNAHVGTFKLPNCADIAANVCLICLSVMTIVKVLALFWGHGRPSLVNFRHHGHGFTFRKWLPWLICLSWRQLGRFYILAILTHKHGCILLTLRFNMYCIIIWIILELMTILKILPYYMPNSFLFHWGTIICLDGSTVNVKNIIVMTSISEPYWHQLWEIRPRGGLLFLIYKDSLL